MNKRELFRAVMAFEKVGRPCHIEQGFLPGTYEKWQQQGLPANIKKPVFEYIADGPDLFDHYNILRCAYVLGWQYFLPVLSELIEETDRYIIAKDIFGRTVKNIKDFTSAPQFLDYTIKTKKDYDALKERLQPHLDKRYPADWDNIAASMRNQDRVLVVVQMDGFYGCPRQMIGDEELMMAYYTDPDFVKQIINDRVDFYLKVYEKAILDTKPDFVFIWEDMCYRNGPLISPEMFREFMLPAYKKLTSFLKSLGVKNIVVDSDGDVTKLIPLWLEGGVTGLLPFEAKTQMNLLNIAEDFPRLQIIGGINKHELEKGQEEIDAELDRLLPALLKRSGYIVSLDHWVHPQVPLKNFEYYVKKVRAYMP
jgi:uroporphyrinogen-III decarboxylase